MGLSLLLLVSSSCLKFGSQSTSTAGQHARYLVLGGRRCTFLEMGNSILSARNSNFVRDDLLGWLLAATRLCCDIQETCAFRKV